MENKINYTLVGLFVVLLLAGLITFAYWLGKYGGQQEYNYYHVHMSESVAGLTTDASVKYRGVNVGTVEQVRLNPKNSEQVELLLKIKQNTPIRVDTTATLKSFGLTGLSYVELAGEGHNTPLLTTSADEIPIIPAGSSTFARIDESLSSLTTKAALALDKFNLLLSEENLHNVSATLAEIKTLAKDMRAQQEGFQDLVDNGVIMEKRVTKAFDKIEVASISVKEMADNLEENSSLVGHNMSQAVEQSLESFNQLLSELNILARHLQKTTQGFEASPSDLIFKSSKPKPGPGEEGYHEK
ncbi:MAG: MCE family protein [Methylococcales bacterium]|nr:MCE family protein [Methylococcales bacterium]